MQQRALHLLLATHAVAASAARPPASLDECSGPVQPQLLYGISRRVTPRGVPAPIDVNESLAEAVCCDKRALPFAEPQFLYKQLDIGLFRHVTKTTTFYDSVCGLPLFRAPVNRTLNDFKADTDEHGWPSFRAAEVFADNVRVADGLVTSTCGTHLGTYLPDDKGPRWCIDLACVAGHRALNATLSTDKCGGVDVRSYVTPLNICYSPSQLFPGDPQWGAFDVRDSITPLTRRLRRAFYDTKDGSCGAETDHFDVPLDQCVGPFGTPRPWGEFSLVGSAAMASAVA
jgi:peptide methionine sulfoxide reductase MsrB